MAKQKARPYVLLKGVHSAWDGDKATGSRKRYVAGTKAGDNVGVGTRVSAGDTLYLTDEEAAAMGDRVKPILDQYEPLPATATVGKDSSNPSPSNKTLEDDEDDGDDSSDPSGMTVADVKEALAGMGDASEVKALRDAEAKGAGRKGVLDAADARLAELSKK